MVKTFTIQEAWAAFVRERAVALCASSLDTDYRMVTKWLGRAPVQDLAAGRDLLNWVLRQEPRRTSLKVGMFVKAFYKWAAQPDVGLVPVSPVASFRFPKKPQGDDDVVVIQRHEVPLVMASLERRARCVPRWDAWARFQLQTGLRTGEVRAVRSADVEGDRLLVHANYTLRHGLKDSTKTNRARWVPLNPVARGILDSCPADADGYLFPWNRYSFQSYFNDRMRELAGQGVISRVYRPYDLRHTAISWWLEAGVSVAQAAAWAGNTAQVIWAHYAGTSHDVAMPVFTDSKELCKA